MEKGIILRYGELHLKGKNRGFFEKKLVDDIKIKLKPFECKLLRLRGRYFVTDFDDSLTDNIVSRCKQVFGLHSLSVALVCRTEVNDIFAACERVVANFLGVPYGSEAGFVADASSNGDGNTDISCAECCVDNRVFNSNKEMRRLRFRVSANRADKSFEYNSLRLSAEAGGLILSRFASLEVDLHAPDFVVSIDVREEGRTFVFISGAAVGSASLTSAGGQLCAGGMPLGSSGRGVLLLSGGLDSPVAGYMMMRRGLILDALHFHSYPYTNEQAQKKVEDLAAKLAAYSGSVRLHMVKLTEIQERIKQCCDERFSVIVLRMIMMRVAEKVALRLGCGCLVNGESLGQVASQTLESLMITDSVVNMPVFRPLIGLDKQDIIEVARKIDTYDTAILPFEDCCTVFLPKHPVTRPSPEAAAEQYSKLIDLDAMIEEALAGMENKTIRFE